MHKTAMTDTQPRETARLLVIRFSSFGDIVQAIGVPDAFRRQYPNAKVDWLVRDDFQGLLSSHPALNRVISFERKAGLVGLVALAWRLSGEGYTHLYDAHSNLRSAVVRAVFSLRSLLRLATGAPSIRLAKRSKDRLRRWLFFRFRLRTLPQPFRGADSFHRPLVKWGLPPRVPEGQQFFSRTSLPETTLAELQRLPRPWVALAPSAAWEMKRWPTEHWKKLIRELPQASFVFLGGPEDRFIDELEQEAPPERRLNLAGRLSLAQSSALLQEVDLLIANDTGLLHVADQMETPVLALIGPTAFGYPSHATSRTLEIELPCKPCSKDGRGRCINAIYKRCLVDLKPESVSQAARNTLAEGESRGDSRT